MTLSAATLARDDIPKIVTITISATLRSDYSAVTIRLTDGRSVIDASGNVYASRITDHGWRRSTGSESAPGDPGGTGMGNPVSPNIFSFTVDNRPDGEGNTLDIWRTYILTDATIDVSLGAEYDENGNAVAVSDYEDLGRYYLIQSELGDTEFRLVAKSHEGFRSAEPLRRRRYLGVGPHGIDLPGNAAKGAAGSGSTLTLADGYTIGLWLSMDLDPFTIGVDAFLLRIGNGATDGMAFWTSSIPDIGSLSIIYYSGAGSTNVWLRSIGSLGTDRVRSVVLRVGAEAGGEQALEFYFQGKNVKSTTIATTHLTEPSPAAVAVGYGFDGRIWEAWVFDSDIGDALAREYSAGPLVPDSSMTTLHHLWQMNDWSGGGGSTVEDAALATAVPLTLDSGVTFVDSREGPNPNLPSIGLVAGGTVPYLIGRRAAFPPVLIQPWSNTWEVARSGAVTVHGGSIDGQPIQIELDYTGVVPMRKSVLTRDLNIGTGAAADNTALSVITLDELAAVALAEVRSIARGGTIFEISGHPTNNGTAYRVVDICGPDVYFHPDIVATDLSSSCTLSIPATGEPGGWNASSSDGLIVAPRPISGRLLLDAEALHGQAAPFPTIEDLYALLVWAKDRDDASAGEVNLEDFDWTPTVAITWVAGAGDLRYEPLSLGIYTGEDPRFDVELGEALDGCFCWSSNSATLGGLPGVRMGHWRAPDGTGTAYTEAQVLRDTFRELGARPPTWQLTILYQPRDLVISSVAGVLTPAEISAATLPYRRVEIYRDETIRANFPGAVTTEWKTPIHSLAGAKRLGQLIRDVIQVERRWITFVLDVRPETLAVGEDITLAHEKLTGGTADLIITAVDGIAGRRGTSVIAYY